MLKPSRPSLERSSSGSSRDSSKQPLVLAAVNFRKPKHHLGELYTTMVKLMMSKSNGYGRWQLKDVATPPFDLCFGESIGRGIPFKTLASLDGGRARPPIVNFYQNFKSLTWKLDMVVTLRRYQPYAVLHATCVT